MNEHEQRGVQAGDADEHGDHGDEVEQAGLLPGDLVARTVPQFVVDDQPADQPADQRGDRQQGEHRDAERPHVKGDPPDVAARAG